MQLNANRQGPQVHRDPRWHPSATAARTCCPGTSANPRSHRPIARNHHGPGEATASALWKRFSQSFSGEWEGVTASFRANGEPAEIDPHYVPQAYRDWGVQLYDWQTTCSSLALAEEPSVQIVCRRMMPTVGCEADAIAFTEEAQSGQQLAAFSPCGSYVAAPREIPADASQAVIEIALIVSPVPETDLEPLPSPAQQTTTSQASTTSTSTSSTGDETAATPTIRLRLVHHLQRDWASKAWALSKVDVHHERWDSEYRGLVELTGCGGGMPTFAQQPAIDASAVLPARPPDRWHRAWSLPDLPPALEYPGVGVEGTKTEHETLLRLPLGAWSRITFKHNAQNTPDGTGPSVCIQAGALYRATCADPLQPQTAADAAACIARCAYEHGALVQAAVGRQLPAREEPRLGVTLGMPWEGSEDKVELPSLPMA